MENNINKKWVHNYRENINANYSVFFFTFAGSTSAYFAPWARYFPENVNIYPVQYPARENRLSEPMPNSLFDLAYNMVDDSIELFEKPFVFVGHCSGNLIAFEAAQYLRKKYNKCPECMFIFACIAPEDYKLKSTKNLSNEAFFRYYNYSEYERFKDDPLFDYTLPLLRQDYIAIEKYRYKEEPPLDIPFFTFAADDDPDVKDPKNMLKWKKYTTSDDFELEVYKGNHLFSRDYSEELSQIIYEKSNKYIMQEGQ